MGFQETFIDMFYIKKFETNGFLIFLYLIALYVFFAFISSILIVTEERKKESQDDAKIGYGGFIITASLILLIFLMISIINVHGSKEK
jgi:xanthine/uracil permease